MRSTQSVLQSRQNYFNEVHRLRGDAGIYSARGDAYEDVQETRMLQMGLSYIVRGVDIYSKKIPKSQEVREFFAARGYEATTTATGGSIFFLFDERVADAPYLMVYYTINGTFKVHGLEADATKLRDELKEKWPSSLARVSVARGLADNRLQISSQMATISTDPMQCFYPFLREPVDDLLDKYMADKATVLILIGPPGTGKTSFLRHLITRNKIKALLCYERTVLESPVLFSHARDNNFELLALEDADNFVRSRERGNDHMVTLLNDTQGVTDGSNMKIVISTNLETLNQIDRALLRKGRCFDVLFFRPLVREEIEIIWKTLGREPTELQGNGPWTLSDALNPEHYFDTDPSHSRNINPIGFMSGVKN